MTTIRARQNSIIERHTENVIHAYSGAVAGTGRCRYCQRVHPCPDYSDAVVALRLLEEAERERNDSRDPSNRYPLDRVLIDDPEPVVSP